MKSTRIHIARFITLIVALQILNLGLFAQHFEPLQATASTEEFNIINSMVEYIAEVVLQHKNAIPETQDQKHQKDLQPHKHIIIKLIGIEREPVLTSAQNAFSKTPRVVAANSYYQFCKEIVPPPPKA